MRSQKEEAKRVSRSQDVPPEDKENTPRPQSTAAQARVTNEGSSANGMVGMSLDDIFAKKWSNLTSAKGVQHPMPVTPELNGHKATQLRLPSPSVPGWLSPAWSGE